MRHAFGLPQVLLIILFIGGIVTVTMRYASMGTKHYADSYTREQAELFLHSTTEVALMQIGAFDRNATGHDECLKDFNITSSDKKFEANVTIEHYYLPEGVCKDTIGNTISSLIGATSIYEKPEAMIQINIIVTSKSSQKVGNHIRLERRSLQRP